MRTIRADCCGNVDLFLVGDTFSPTRVRAEGVCPVCGAVDPMGTIQYPDDPWLEWLRVVEI